MNKLTKVLLIAIIAIALVFAVLTFLNYQQWKNSTDAVQNISNDAKNYYIINGNQAGNSIQQNSEENPPAPVEEDSIVLREIKDSAELEKIFAIADQNEYYQNFIKGKDFSVKAFDLNAEQIAKFKEKNNAVYMRLPGKNLVELDYESAQNGKYLMFIDVEQAKVLFFTKIMMLNLS